MTSLGCRASLPLLALRLLDAAGRAGYKVASPRTVALLTDDKMRGWARRSTWLI